MNEKLKSWGVLCSRMSYEHHRCMREGKQSGKAMGLNVIKSRGRLLYMGDYQGRIGEPLWDWAVTKKSLVAFVEEAKKEGATWVGVGCDYEARDTLRGEIVEPLVAQGVEFFFDVWTAEEGYLF
jgi:hypothetical protein